VRVAVIGARGFVGSALCAAVTSAAHDLVAVTRGSYESARDNGSYDVLINAATPSKRFWARQFPVLDFAETVHKTATLLNDWHWDKFVQISSVSARSQLDTVYGRHKAAAERLCPPQCGLVVRFGPIYGEGLEKGPLIDLAMDRTVFAASESRYCFAPVAWIAETIVANLHAEGIIELGARDPVTLAEVAARIGSLSDFHGAPDHQEVDEAYPSAPSASAVIDYALALKTRLRGDHSDTQIRARSHHGRHGIPRARSGADGGTARL
jgi:nucleoside-diphosphate-sugar epimerase